MVSSRLEMRGISLAFSGFQALSRVNFTLTGGSVHALTGANGAGKSTLMAVLCGTHDHYEGEICINNQPVSIREPLDAKRLGIHLVQQEVDVALIPGLSIAENIMLDQLAQPGHRFSWRSRGIASAGAPSASRRDRRWRSLTLRWMSAVPSTAARLPKSSRFCWRAPCPITAVF